MCQCFGLELIKRAELNFRKKVVFMFAFTCLRYLNPTQWIYTAISCCYEADSCPGPWPRAYAKAVIGKHVCEPLGLQRGRQSRSGWERLVHSGQNGALPEPWSLLTTARRVRRVPKSRNNRLHSLSASSCLSTEILPPHVTLISHCFLTPRGSNSTWRNSTSFTPRLICAGGAGGYLFICLSYGFVCSWLLSCVYEDTNIRVNVVSEMERSVNFRPSLGGSGFGDGWSWYAVTSSYSDILIFNVKMKNDFILSCNSGVSA